MALSEQDVTKIQEVFRTEIRSFLDDQGLDFNEHSEHHSFICSVRKRLQTAWKAGIWTVVGVVTAGMVGLVWQTISNGGI